jgi:hypothetical protein
MLQVGQKLWYVPHHRWHGAPREIIVESIGRKCGKIDERGSKIDLNTLVVHDRDMGGIAQCYVDRAAYESDALLGRTWRDFQRRLNHHPPAGVTTEEIIALAAKWGIPLEEKGKS